MRALHGWIAKYGEDRVRYALARLHVDLDDVWAGRVTHRHAIHLLGRSIEEPGNTFRREELGDELGGWDTTTAEIAHLSDLLAALLAGLSGKSMNLYRRKRVDKRTQNPAPVAPTIAEFDLGRFMAQINA